MKPQKSGIAGYGYSDGYYQNYNNYTETEDVKEIENNNKSPKALLIRIRKNIIEISSKVFRWLDN